MTMTAIRAGDGLEQLTFDFEIAAAGPPPGVAGWAGPSATPAGQGAPAPPGVARSADPAAPGWAGPSTAGVGPGPAAPPSSAGWTGSSADPAAPGWAGPSTAATEPAPGAPPSSAGPMAEPGAAGWAGPSAYGEAAEWARPDGPPPAAEGALPPTRPATSAEARRAAARFATLCLEVLNGFRPAGHVRPLASPTDASRVVDRLVVANHRLRRRPSRAQAEQMKLRLLRVSEPRPGVVEAAATLGTPHRTWAMAFRLERGAPNRWLGTALEVL